MCLFDRALLFNLGKLVYEPVVICLQAPADVNRELNRVQCWSLLLFFLSDEGLEVAHVAVLSGLDDAVSDDLHVAGLALPVGSFALRQGLDRNLMLLIHTEHLLVALLESPVIFL